MNTPQKIHSLHDMVELEGDLPESPLSNADIAPTRIAQRSWNTWHIASLWVGMSVCIPTYMLAASMIGAGMNWWQSLLVIFLGNAIVLLPLILNAHAGTKYGIPFPVYVRASFGIKGAHIPSILRALVACGWFGIQTWIGGMAINVILGILWPGWLQLGGSWTFMGFGLSSYLSFVIFWFINMYFVWAGTESIKWMETIAAPFLLLMGIALLIWAATKVGGIGTILAQSDALIQSQSSLSFSQFILTLFIPWLTAMVGYWATLSLNIPDFTRYAKSQKDQMLGQSIGLLTTMPLFSFIGIAVTSATLILYGEAIWDPIQLLSKLTQDYDSPLLGLLAMFVLVVATLSTNIAANVVSSANSFSNLLPQKITFRMGGLLAGLIGILIMPWKLLDMYLTWLISYSGLLGAVGGIIVCDYFVLRRRNLNLPDLYNETGEYIYSNGINRSAMIALIAGIAVALAGKLHPNLDFLFNGAWFSAAIISFGVYYFLMKRRQTILPLIKQARLHGTRLAIIDEHGQYTYGEILSAAEKIASFLLQEKEDLQEARIAYMVPPGFDYVAVQWGIWLAGGIAVPLCLSHPLPEIEYVLQDTDAAFLIVHPNCKEKLQPLAAKRSIRFVQTNEAIKASPKPLPEIDTKRRAMILYTSGTTSKPKGVVLTHQNITAQIASLIEAWEWKEEDHILHVLPLHHTHGIINVLSCALWVGATCEMLPKFDTEEVWHRFLSCDLTLFMAVPTIYAKLIAAWENAPPERQKAMSQACAKMRLMVSGSAALPLSIFEKWRAISGHTLLERYGMTEIGMALSNPLHGERRPGAVGVPLPGVQVKLFDEVGFEILEEGKPGEIRVKGPNVFLEYWQKHEATQNAFTEDGWFLTGDMAVFERNYFKILGRSSVDIIKTGGYKVSALEIEDALRAHPEISECAVIGVPDEEWGERICAAIVSQNNTAIALEDLRVWAKERLAHYKIPTRLLTVNELPRNVMGKVTKPEVKRLFEKFS